LFIFDWIYLALERELRWKKLGLPNCSARVLYFGQFWWLPLNVRCGQLFSVYIYTEQANWCLVTIIATLSYKSVYLDISAIPTVKLRITWISAK